MNLSELNTDGLALISYIDYNDSNIEKLYEIMKLGVVPGVEIRKISEVSTCAEYRVEGMAPRIVIDKCLSDYIIITTLDE
jgi:Fe2+ transport system protein FeoA